MFSKSEIHIVIVKVDYNFIFEKYLYLFHDEITAKIKNYRFRKDQLTAFTSEILKRYYLPSYLKINPLSLNIKYNQYGRPFIDRLLNVDFNISHSGDYVVMIIARNAKVGIDIEEYKQNINPREIGYSVFSESEQNLVGNNVDKFLVLWTKKEALIKAYGTGFGSDIYNKNQLNLNTIEALGHYVICYIRPFKGYFLAICVLYNNTL